MKTIHSPEGVSLLMENLWLRQKAGPSNVYIVELPPPTEEQLADARQKTQDNTRLDDEPEDLFGAWI